LPVDVAVWAVIISDARPPRCPIWSKLNSPELGLGAQHNYAGAHEKVGNVWGDGSFLNSVDGITPNALMPSDSRKNMAVFF